MNVLKKIASTVLSAAMAVTTFAAPLVQTTETVMATDVYLSKGEKYEYGTYKIGNSSWCTHRYSTKFHGETHWAYCIAPNKHSPESGNFGLVKKKKGSDLAKILYFGDARAKSEGRFGGDDNYWIKHHKDYQEGKRWCITHLAAGRANNQAWKDYANSATENVVYDLYDYCTKRTIPNFDFTINKNGAVVGESDPDTTHVTSNDEMRLSVLGNNTGISWSKNNKISGPYVISCNSAQKVTITLPSNARMVYVSGSKYKQVNAGKSQTLGNGRIFYIVSTSPQKANTGYTTNNIKMTGKEKDFNCYILKNKKQGKQDLACLDSFKTSLYMKVTFGTPQPRTFHLHIVKKDEDTGATLQGAVFGLFKDAGCTQAINGNIVVGDQTIDVPEDAIKPNNYVAYLKEIAAPKGYELDDSVDTINFNNDADTTVEITKTDPKAVRIVVKKIGDVYDSTPTISLPSNPKNMAKHPNATVEWKKTGTKLIEGATVGLYANQDGLKVNGNTYNKGQLIYSNTTNAQGEIWFDDGLSLGSYYVEELQPPTNSNPQYARNTKQYPVTLTEANYNEAANIYLATQEITETPILIHTIATDADNGTHDSKPAGQITLVDQVAYKGTEAGKKYTLTGTLMDKTTGEPVKNDGKDITGSTTFKPTSDQGVVYVDFKFDSSDLGGHNLVVYENLVGPKYNDKGEQGSGTLAKHEDMNDEGQTVKIPPVNIVVKKTGDIYDATPVVSVPSNPENMASHPDATVEWKKTGTKDLSGAVIGLYSNQANLRVGDKRYNKGELIYSAKTNESGEVEFDEKLPLGSYYVEELQPPTNEDPQYSRNTKQYPVEITEANFNKTQYVYLGNANIPNTPVMIHTTATDAETGSHYAKADEDVTIVDQVAYKGTEIGKEYTFKGTLMDKNTGKPVQNDGKDVVGSTTFKPTSDQGVVYVDFKFKASDLGNHDVVVYESLIGPKYDENGKESKGEVAKHKDMNDEGQTVHFPDIHTTTTDTDTGDDRSYADEEITVLDKIVYQNIDPDKTYQIEGTLVDKKTGKPITTNEQAQTEEDESKTEETKSDESKTDKKTETKSENASTESKTDTKSEESKTEETKSKDASTETKTKETKSEESKTTTKSEDASTDTKTDTKSEDVGEPIKATSVVYYVKATQGEKSKADYIVSDDGTSVRKVAKGEGTYLEKQPDPKNPLAFNSKAIGGDKDGVIYAKFTFPGKNLAGRTAVVFEDLKDEKYSYATHADLKDEDQTQYFPQIHTTVVDQDSKTNLTSPDRDVNITDTVSYKNLKKGDTYMIEGYLVDKATGEKIKDDDGKVVYAIKEFTAEDNTGTVEMPFHFQGTKLKEGVTMVVFETLYKDRPESKNEELKDSKTTSVEESKIIPDENKIIYATHKDLEDEKQTIYVPNIKTKVTDKTTGTNTTHIAKDIEVVDTVTYKNLLSGKTYTMEGKLMDKKTGDVIKDASGNEVTAKTEFTPEKSDGTVDVVFKFDGSNLVGGYTMVAFEKLMYEEKDYAVHEDINDQAQSEYVPEIHTTANGSSETPMIMAEKNTKIVDTVAYANLCPGTPYILKGTLMDKSTGQPMKTKAGKEIVAEANFTPSEEIGTTNVTFTFDGTGLEGKTGVVFEKVLVVNPTTGEQTPVAEHEDINDIPQTIFVPEIHTKATIGDEKSATVKSNTKVKDVVSYKNLVAGEQYLIRGTLMDKKTKKAIKVDGEKVIADATFTATDTSGEQTVNFKFDSTKLAGHDAVVFEKFYVVKNGKYHKIATHENIKDKSQTVHLKPKKKTFMPKKTSPSGKVQTGDTMKMAIYLVVALVAVGGASTILIKRKKKN